ncbi:MAG: flagellar export chaperone FliS [Acidobacteriota bacterium]
MALGQNLTGRYQSMEVNTADPLDLVILLYKGAIKESRLAARYIQESRTEARVNSINKAIAIVGELQACLDFKKGGQIANSLDRLYGYMTRRLTTANIKQDAEALNEVAKLLEDLLSGWEGAQAKQSESTPEHSRRASGPVRDRLTLSQGGASVSFSY